MDKMNTFAEYKDLKEYKELGEHLLKNNSKINVDMFLMLLIKAEIKGEMLTPENAAYYMQQAGINN